MDEMCNFEAKVLRILYQNEETNSRICQVYTKTPIPYIEPKFGNYYITIVGTFIPVEEGDIIQVSGNLMSHPKYGYQIKIKDVYFNKPLTKKEVLAFLKAILTVSQANVLYDNYPDIIDKIIEDEDFTPDLNKLKGIGKTTWEKIKTKIINNFACSDIIALLNPLGCSLTMINNIMKQYKSKTLLIEEIKKNPYCLCKFKGLGFKKVDTYALNLKPELKDSLERIEACVKYIFDELGDDEGHCWLSYDILLNKVKELIGTIAHLQECINKQQTLSMKYQVDSIYDMYSPNNNHWLFVNEDKTKIGLLEVYNTEKYIFFKLKDIYENDNIWELDENYFQNKIQEVNKLQGFNLSEEQLSAVHSIADNNVTLISGKAGCVDCDTEYFNGKEWVRIADYQQGDKVLQYDIDTHEASLATPLLYHKYPCTQLWHFEDSRGNIDQVLCDEHNILKYNGEKIKVKDWLKNPQIVFIPSSFYYYDTEPLGIIHFQRYIDKNINITPYLTKDGYKYCFTMPLGTLILRRNGKIFITGNCGKTSIIKAIIQVYANKDIAMGALSAKAAQRMKESSGFQDAKTIHRLLGFNRFGFTYNEDHPLPYDLVIIDECSMNNIYIFKSLLKAIDSHTKIIFVGDIKQLPSIGTGSVFSDLINTNIFNRHYLTEIYRQSDNSYIVLHANEIREGKIPMKTIHPNMKYGNDTFYFFRNNSDDICNITVNLFLQFLQQGITLEDLIIITPIKVNGSVCCNNLNNIIQHELLSQETKLISSQNKTFKLGARIINRKNDYDRNILNGEMGTIIDIQNNSFTVKMDNDHIVSLTKADMDNIDLGYAISCHSSQGSQYHTCIFALDSNSYKLLSSNLIYTAMTRAKERIIVVANPRVFTKAVLNVSEQNRNTFLSEFLQDYKETS